MIRVLSATFAAGLLLAGCSGNQQPPTDTGSMQTPTPSPGSGVVNSTVGGRPVDTGSMTVPAAVNQQRIPARTSVDTGSMSVPKPQ